MATECALNNALTTEKKDEVLMPASIKSVFSDLNEKADCVYRFAALYSGYMAEKNDYGTGLLLTMAEAHALAYINEHVGLTVRDLATAWNQTPSAASQIVTKLENKGLVEKQAKAGSKKSLSLYVTKQGEELCKAHILYDALEVTKTLTELMETCSAEEIEAFFKVVKAYNVLLMEDD